MRAEAGFPGGEPALTGIHAIVLAGDRGPYDPVAVAAGVPAKCLTPIGGSPMVVRVVRALRDPLIQAPGVAGATELGDGRPVLILDAVAFTGGAVRPNEPTPGVELN